MIHNLSKCENNSEFRLQKYPNALLIMLDPWVLISAVDDAKLSIRKFGYAFGKTMETNAKGNYTGKCWA